MYPWGYHAAKETSLHSYLKAGSFQELYDMLDEGGYQTIDTGPYDSYFELHIQKRSIFDLFYNEIFSDDGTKFYITERDYSYFETSQTVYDEKKPVVYLIRETNVYHYSSWARYMFLQHGFNTNLGAYAAYSGETNGTHYHHDWNYEEYWDYLLMIIGGMGASTKTPQHNSGQYISWYRVEAI